MVNLRRELEESAVTLNSTHTIKLPREHFYRQLHLIVFRKLQIHKPLTLAFFSWLQVHNASVNGILNTETIPLILDNKSVGGHKDDNQNQEINL